MSVLKVILTTILGILSIAIFVGATIAIGIIANILSLGDEEESIEGLFILGMMVEFAIALILGVSFLVGFSIMF